MKISLLDQYKQGKLVGALTPDLSLNLYQEIKDLSKDYIPKLNNNTYNENDLDQLVILAKLIKIFLVQELKNQEPQFLSLANQLNRFFSMTGTLMPLYPNAEFEHDVVLEKYIIRIPFGDSFSCKDHNAWILLNLINKLTISQESLFVFYLYMIHTKDDVLALKKAWAFFEFDRLKKISLFKTK